MNNNPVHILSTPGSSVCPQQLRQEHAKPATGAACCPGTWPPAEAGPAGRSPTRQSEGQQLRQGTLAQLLPPQPPSVGMLSPSTMHAMERTRVHTNRHCDNTGSMKMALFPTPTPPLGTSERN